MKFTSTLVFVLASAVAATPVGKLRRQDQGTQDAITNSINQWFNDIIAVNNFLNNVLSSATPSEDAVPILAIAQDEPTQLGILTGFLSPDDSNGMQASQNLQVAFPAVPSSLQDIINAGDDPNAVAAAVAALNANRCFNVLGNIGILWECVTADNGLSGIGFPPGPNDCPSPNPDGSSDYPQVGS